MRRGNPFPPAHWLTNRCQAYRGQTKTNEGHIPAGRMVIATLLPPFTGSSHKESPHWFATTRIHHI
ncbi:BgTH12-07393 [Blumeria graminis f. sp. triticale]|uniref:BgTH12-07393 n=1 Tax=Blumeria graminis f. sp. triticale TaxID=1689686 RepID=A0A9W4GDV1_BLUGR|nr:BgTH12-07393 [Blumeria graminis f. sp. triticale]